MIKFVKLNFYPTCRRNDDRIVCYTVNGNPETLFISLDAIKGISPTPIDREVYTSSRNAYNDYSSSEHTIERVYLVTTNIAVGLGINGVSYNTYSVTEETFMRLKCLIEVF